MYFIDANIFLELELNDTRKGECEKFLESIIRSERKVLTSDFIVYSITLELMRKSALKKAEDFLNFLDTIKNIDVCRPTLKILLDSLNKMRAYNLDFDDALVVSCMSDNKVKNLVSFDKHFDRVKEIKRVEPKDVL